MKTYCVHVYPRPTEYENVRAKTPDDAKTEVVARDKWYWDDIDHIAVMRQCKCGQDNDVDEKTCQTCGETL